jgi:hypothetical protein
VAEETREPQRRGLEEREGAAPAQAVEKCRRVCVAIEIFMGHENRIDVKKMLEAAPSSEERTERRNRVLFAFEEPDLRFRWKVDDNQSVGRKTIEEDAEAVEIIVVDRPKNFHFVTKDSGKVGRDGVARHDEGFVILSGHLRFPLLSKFCS